MLHDEAARTKEPQRGHFPRTEAEAKHHIAQIGIKKALNGTADSSLDLEAALDLISSELYQKPFRFLLELLQNADDNSYDVIEPEMTICLKEGMLRVDTNEIGFTKENVEAICSFGRSSKPILRQEATYIGEKGIGFKSVFKVADVVWITSGQYSFKFDTHERLGRLVPIWTEFPLERQVGRTSILLKLRGGWDICALEEELKSLNAGILMFLRNVSLVNIEIWQGDEVMSTALKRHTPTNKVEEGLPVLILEPDVLSPYLIFEYGVSGLQHDARRGHLSRSLITLAFPKVHSNNSEVESRNVYSYLPVRDYGFKFVLQSDFILIANREDIDSSSNWNKSLLERVPQALLAAITLFNRGNFRYSWLPYISTRKPEPGPFRSVYRNILALLSSQPILESMHEDLQPPDRLVIVPKSLSLDMNKPLIPFQVSQYRYISPKYGSQGLGVLSALGVRTLSGHEFLNDLAHFVSEHYRMFQKMPLDWHSSLARVLLPLVQEFRDQISALPIFPLRNGRWAARDTGNMLMPLKLRNLTIPGGLPFEEIHPDIMHDPSRQELLKLLGVGEANLDRVCNIILKMHANIGSPPEAVSVVDLVSHALFLYEAKWTPSHRVVLWFAAEGGSRHLAPGIYLNDPNIVASAGSLFGKNWGRFLHSFYSQAFHRYTDWRNWFTEKLGVDRIPRLVSHISGSSMEFTISVDFKYLMTKQPSSVVLHLLKYHWESYAPWIKPCSFEPGQAVSDSSKAAEASKSTLRAEFHKMMVSCLGGLISELSQTYLPREKVLLGLGLSDFGSGHDPSHPHPKASSTVASNSSLSRNSTPDHPFLDISDPEDRGWDFLKYFGVITALKAEHFVEKLRQMSGTYVDKGLVSRIYEEVMSCLETDDVSQTVYAFRSEKLLFIPAKITSIDSSWRWVSAEDCVWNGPVCLRRIPRLQEHYNQPVFRSLFRKLIGIPVANLNTMITELQQVDNHDAFEHLRSICIETGKMVENANYTELTEVSAAERLEKSKIWPIRIGKSDSGYDYLAESTESWYIADYNHLRTAFTGKLPFLAFDRLTIDYMMPLLDLLALNRRLLSKLAKLQTAVDGELTFLPYYTAALRRKARFIARLVPVSRKGRDRTLGHLRNIEVYQAQHVSLWWTVITTTGEYVRGEVEQGRVCIIPVPQNEQLKIYLVKQDADLSCPPLELTEQLANLCGITDTQHVSLLSHTLVQQSIRRIADDFDKKGLNADAPGFAGEYRNAGDYAEQRSTDHFGGSAALDTRSTLVVQTEGKSEPDTTLSSYADRPSLEFIENGDELLLRPDTIDRRGSQSYAERDLLANSPIPARSSFEGNNPWYNNHNKYRLVRSKPSNNPIQYGLTSLSVPEPSNVTGDEERLLASELYVSRFIQEVLGDWYRPNEHWTSSLRSKAGHTPLSNDAVGCSTFTIQDTSGNLKTSLVQMGCEEAKSLTDPATFHFQVVVTGEALHSSFTLASAQAEKAEKLFRAATRTPIANELFILAVVFSLDEDPSMALFADPWRLRQDGLLTLEAYSDFWGCINDDANPLYVQINSSERTSRIDSSGFKYRSLRSSEIRILTLSPGIGDEPLQGVIEEVSLEEAGNFCALSYVWGVKPTLMAPSYLHTPGGVLRISSSLHSALTAVRDQFTEKRLWVDAVCINQEDIMEKVMQIRLMNSIFQTAHHAIAWLGHEEDGSNEAIDALKKINQEAKSSYWPRFLGGNAPSQVVVPGPNQAIWNSLDALLDRPWFKRMWIVQELVLPTNVLLLCGKSKMDWDDFFDALTICEQDINIGVAPGSENIRILTHAGAAYALGVTRKRLKVENRKYGLLELIELFAHGQATIGIDKLFALLGIAVDSSHEDFDPDYDSPKEEVIKRYAKRFVKKGQVMDLLYRAGTPKSYPYCSWIPEFTRAKFPQTISTWEAAQGDFYAGPRVLPRARLQEEPGSKAALLHVRGLEIDSIASTRPLRIITRSFASFLEALEDIRNLTRYIAHYPSDESLEDVLTQLPIGNAKRPHLEAASDRLRQYRDFTKHAIKPWPSDLKKILLSLKQAGDTADISKMPTENRAAIILYWRTAAAFMDRLSRAALCVTTRGYIGLVPGDSEPGDMICVLHGGKVPFVIRNQGSEHSLKGECYVHGIMHGQGLELPGVSENEYHLV